MNDRQLKWEVARERFHISDPFPPQGRREEKTIRDILGSILQKDEEASEILPSVITDRWPLIAGEQLANHTRPAYLKNEILYIHADHPGWLAESRRLPKMNLLKKISLIPEFPKIKDIRFQLETSLRTHRQ